MGELTLERVTDGEIVEALSDAQNGVTVWGRRDAEVYRQLEKDHPNLIDIVSPDRLAKIGAWDGNGAGRMPYFGVIATGKGEEVIANLREGVTLSDLVEELWPDGGDDGR